MKLLPYAGVRGLASLLALALLACDGATPPEPPITGPYTVRIVAGDSQTVVRGADAIDDITIELRDVRGRPAPGVGVNWQAPAGVSFRVAQGMTDSAGRASARLRTACTSQSGSVTVAPSSEAASTATFAFSVVAGPPVALFGSDTVRMLDGEVTTARVSPRDACGPLPLPGSTTWTATVPAVVTVDGAADTSGQLTAGAPGRAAVIATAYGFRDTLPVTVHAPATGMRTIAMVAGGTTPGFGCGLDAAGDVYCWGGSGWTDPNETTGPRPFGARRVLAGHGFTRLTIGSAQVCALDGSGAAFCWGPNLGLVGDGTTIQRFAPVAVGGSLRFTDIAAGGGHTCAVTAGGEAWCWGRNANGQLGDGTTTDRLMPVRVETTQRFTQVVAAGRFTCGLSEGGATWCWGDGPDPWGSFTAQAVTTPTLLAGAPPFAKLAAGYTNACGLSLEGEAWCWGYSPPRFQEQFLPLVNSGPTRIDATRRYESIAVGVAHACAVTGAGEVDCWGANEKAQLGFHDGTSPSRHSAAPVAVVPLASVFAASTGDFTCGVNAAGNVYCWGRTFAGLEHPGAITCAWGTRISYRGYECTLPRAVAAALPPGA